MSQQKTRELNQPSPEAIRALVRFIIKTSVPRLIAKKGEKERKEAEEKRLKGE